MQGAQPSPKTAPSSGRPEQPGARPPVQLGLALAAEPGADAEEDQPHDDDEGPTHPHQQLAVLDERPAGPRDEHRGEDEHHGEAGDEEHGTEHGAARDRRSASPVSPLT